MDEYTNSTAEVDDGSDMFLDDEPTSEITEDVEQPQQENADPVQPEQKEAPAKEEGYKPLKVKHLHSEMEIATEAEAIALIQKGLDYDRIREDRDSVRIDASARQVLEEYAEANGVNLEDFMKHLKDNLRSVAVNGEMEKIRSEYPDAPEQVVKELAEQRVKGKRVEREQQKTTQKQLEAEAAKRKEMEPWLAFAARYPDKTELTPEEVKLVQAGRTPIEARLEYEKAQREKEVAELKLKLETKEKNQKNKEKAVGSVSSTAGDSPVDDPFLRGFNG